MGSVPYFPVTKDSFEKNAGYKSTVHALSELIDNSIEEDATHVAVLLMVDRNEHLKQIAVLDNGNGMTPKDLQAAVCEKSGKHMDRKSSAGKNDGRRKFGKYGVGLPKSSISQCSKFTVWSWQNKGPSKAHFNEIDTQDDEWIKHGAQVPEPVLGSPPMDWLKVAGLQEAKSGTLVLWENLDGLTWCRARWGQHHGLIPNLDFMVGRVYRKFLIGDPAPLKISVHVVNDRFKVTENHVIPPNDPLYLTPNCDIPKKVLPDGTKWPPCDPMFSEWTGKAASMDVPVDGHDGKQKTVKVTWRRSVAMRQTHGTFDGAKAGSLPHGVHAGRNAGISLLREGREVELSQALIVPSEPEQRWIGVEFDFPHELDDSLGMTNNKQSYTRLDQILHQDKEEYQDPGETWQQCLIRLEKEDPNLSICLNIAWKIRDIWGDTKKTHDGMRGAHFNSSSNDDGGGGEGGTEIGEEDDNSDPRDAAEAIASDNETDGAKPYEGDPEKHRERISEELQRKEGLSKVEADAQAAHVVSQGLKFAIRSKENLGSSFFGVGQIVDTNFIDLNSTHKVYPYLLDSVLCEETDPVQLKERLNKAKIAVLLMLEAWAHIEKEAPTTEKARFQYLREDWGRKLKEFVDVFERKPELASKPKAKGRTATTKPS